MQELDRHSLAGSRPIARTDAPTVFDETRRLRGRRALILALNLVTVAVLFAAMAALLSAGGLLGLEIAMLGAYAVTLPWLSIGLWNSVIGLWLDRRHGAGAAEAVTPALGRVRGDEAVTTRTAIVMPLRNEDPDASIARLERLEAELAGTSWADRFAFHVLSDTDREDVARREEALIARWQAARPGEEIAYHRRTDNTGYKAGNIAEFLHRERGFDFFLPLDADSEMGAATVLRMVRVMQAAPEIGVLQSLVTGLPSKTFFTRAFQFGMRHGMRSYTLGSAWWQGDCGPNWGHNVLIRAEPFRRHCMLPVLPGKGPLSGHILSHDQVEAVLMRRAGYEVRVMAEESDSREENPPSLPDFIRRELRWANGNMQYLRLLGMRGLKPVSRLQLLLAIQMYAAAPAWMAFVIAGAALAAVPGQVSAVSIWWGVGFFAFIMALNLFPKVMGVAQVLADHARSAAYGGRARVVSGAFVEVAFSMLIAPIVAVSITRFLIGLLFGRRVGWDAQQRTRARLEWHEAARVLWPQTLLGAALVAWLGWFAPGLVVFAAPILIAFLGAIPIAVWSTRPALSDWSLRTGLFDIPEDRAAALP
ncbi:glucans biosynthesis glucosyltransferase MdoH [Roseivivax sediminis]|uniref:Glucans biosynthesis glucosyltransferase H n=1 Tax=Roseivivax sediminis TaxID=936889 RepID=A0A1I1UNM0_9RHOB|nr:glucans biosynthesis glucosyltransferase MdoH [Roseivivax sediminis]SFD72165.1 membrane glycosyltransferase [Roseivivax sediminis]